MISRRLPPTLIVANPSSQPLMTCPCPSGNANGWRPESSELSDRVIFSAPKPEARHAWEFGLQWVDRALGNLWYGASSCLLQETSTDEAFYRVTGENQR